MINKHQKFGALTAFMFLLIGCPFLVASTNIKPKQNETSIPTAAEFTTCIIQDYLPTIHLEPIFTKDKIKYTHIGFPIYESEDIALSLGVISQGDRAFKAMFSLKKKATLRSLFQIELLYLVEEEILNFQLFEDIMKGFSQIAGLNKDDFQVLVLKMDPSIFSEKAKTDPYFSDAQYLSWTFFNPTEMKKFLVITKPDGQGGSHFSIHTPTND